MRRPCVDTGLLEIAPRGSVIDCAVRERDLDPLFIEDSLDAAKELSFHFPLLKRPCLQIELEDNGRFAEGVHTEHGQLFQYQGAEIRIGSQFFAKLLDQFDHPVCVFLVGDSKVEQGPRPAVRHVRRRGNRSMRNEMHSPFEVAQHGDPQGDSLDLSGNVADLDDVVNRVLLFEEKGAVTLVTGRTRA